MAHMQMSQETLENRVFPSTFTRTPGVRGQSQVPRLVQQGPLPSKPLCLCAYLECVSSCTPCHGPVSCTVSLAYTELTYGGVLDVGSDQQTFSCLSNIKEGLTYKFVVLGNVLICHYSSISIVIIANIECFHFSFCYFRKIMFVSFLAWGSTSPSQCRIRCPTLAGTLSWV